MIDTHTHLFSRKFSEDRDLVVQRAIDAGVTEMYLPNIDADSIEPMLVLAKAYPEHCFPMIGLHPTSVDADFMTQLKKIEQYLHQRKWAAIGEIGTDLYWSDEFWKEQQEAFLIQCNWAIDLGRPVAVHCRDSIDQTLDLVEPLISKGLKGVFHCFTGTIEQAKRAVSYGFYLGIGGVLTYKNNGELSDVVKSVDPTRLVIETDSPYLAPTPYRGKRNESSFLPAILQHLAATLSMEIADLERLTTANARQLFV